MEEKMTALLIYDLQRFAKDGPGGEKTEPATAKKLREAREDGKVTKSRELSSAVDLIALFLLLKIFVSYVGNSLMNLFADTYNAIPDIISNNPGGLTIRTTKIMLNDALIQSLEIMLPFLLAGALIAFLIGLLQVGWKISAKPMMPKGNKINPLNGFKRIFSKDSIFELIKSIAKIVLITYVAYSSVKKNSDVLLLLYDIPLMQAIILIGTVIIDTGLKISLVYLLLGAADWLYQRHKFKEEMKMSKQEVKDEYKNTEGNPETKGRQRQRMREASQRRMMQDVPKADVIITNPTHLAVALKYDAETAKAPVVLAKGEDYLAMKIRETAKENNIEIIENKPLARMLYANVNIGAEIPPELYQAVAEVLAMLRKFKNNG